MGAEHKLSERFKVAPGEQFTSLQHPVLFLDHIFASLLRSFPFSKFSEEDFRRRAYLLASSEALSGLYRHQSLETGQVAILTDDRHHKFREFLSLALETGVVRRQGAFLVKDSSKFSSPLDINRARIDNPIGVIANEVLPLKVMQREVLLTAWMPSIRDPDLRFTPTSLQVSVRLSENPPPPDPPYDWVRAKPHV